MMTKWRSHDYIRMMLTSSVVHWGGRVIEQSRLLLLTVALSVLNHVVEVETLPGTLQATGG